MSKENFELKTASIEAIPTNETIEPNMPVAIAIQEGEDLYEWAQEDKAALEEAGLDMSLLDDIPVRAGALRYAQSIWHKEYQTYEEAQRTWAEKSPAAFDLRDILVHEFFHAYHNYPDYYAKVQAIAEGGGNADMLQDLSDLSVLGKSNPDPLVKITFDLNQLDVAATTSDELAQVLAKANGQRMDSNAIKITRDKAFTYLKQAVDEVRRHGQYKFWRNDSRKKGYVSRYFRSHRQSSKN